MAQQSRLDKYGLTQEEFAKLLEEQGNTCFICGRSFGDWQESKSNIDHDHETGEVRGLLCRNCNTGLGFFRDSIGSLLAAVDYLRTPPARAILRQMRPVEPVFITPLKSKLYDFKQKRVFSKTYRPNGVGESLLEHLVWGSGQDDQTDVPGEFSHRRDNYLSL